MTNENKEEKETRKAILKKVQKKIREIKNYTPKVGILGDSGVGKSSLCNALFGKDVAEISDVEACTREPKEILIGNQNEGGIILIDVPGVGENEDRHDEYIKLYKSLLPTFDLVIWAIKSDTRNHKSAIEAYKEVLKPHLDKCPVVFAITQSDKIEPCSKCVYPNKKYGIEAFELGEKQKENLKGKIIDISNAFGVLPKNIIPVAIHSDDESKKYSYNLIELMNEVVEVLPNEKKLSLVREAEAENISEEASEKAEKGVWESIKETAGEAWDYIKDDVIDEAIDVIKEAGKTLLKCAFKWFKKLP